MIGHFSNLYLSWIGSLVIAIIIFSHSKSEENGLNDIKRKEKEVVNYKIKF